MSTCLRATFEAESIYAIRFAISHLFLQIFDHQSSQPFELLIIFLTLKAENRWKELSNQKTDTTNRFSDKNWSWDIVGTPRGRSVIEKIEICKRWGKSEKSPTLLIEILQKEMRYRKTDSTDRNSIKNWSYDMFFLPKDRFVIEKIGRGSGGPKKDRSSKSR